MYISTFTPLQTALSGVQAAQEELEVTSNNIANANTAGYSDEVVNLGQAPPITTNLGDTLNGAGEQIGTGVDATSISRQRNQFLDVAYRNQSAASSGATTEQSYLNQVQTALNEPNNGISSQLGTFWSDWNQLANDPTSAAAKAAVVNDGTTLTTSFNQLSQQLGQIQTQATQQFTSLTGPGGQVETDANQIAQLNTAIKQQQAAGVTPNNLLDQRDQALDDLSTLANVSVVTNSDGTVTVGFGGAGSPLVNGATVNWPQTLTSSSGGTLGALLNLTQPGGEIAKYSSQLDGVAASLANEVNSVSTNPPFFSGSTAGTIAVNSALTANPTLVETSATGNPGANDVAMGVAALSGGTADQNYTAFVADIGSAVKNANNTARTQGTLTTEINNQRQSTSGVSLSQEMTNLVQEQQAYQASAKVMNTFNTMIGTLLAQVGG